MKLIAIAAGALLAATQPAAAQFWAKQPETQPSSPAQPSSSERSFTEAGDPHTAPPDGPASSLGGSGDTGADSIGTLPERDTGFDRKTWNDTPFTLVLRLTEAMPDRIDSAAEHELAKNLMLSIADAPPGDDGDSHLLELRVRKLLALGNVTDAAALARAAPGLPKNEALAHEEIEAELLARQIEAACIDLRALSGLLTDPASADALLLCRRNAGENIGADVPVADVGTLGAAVRIAGVPLPADPATAPPARLVAAARDPGLPPEQRLEAAFAAGRASALFGETLAGIFESAPAAVAGVSDNDPPPTDGTSAAALYQAIKQEGDTRRKLALSERGLLSPERICDKIGVAMAQPLRDLQPVPELGPFAARFARLFYTVSDIDAATPWAELADQTGGGAALWPYRVILNQADPTGIGDWEQQASLDPASKARLLDILSAFGITRPPKARAAGEDQPEPAFQDLLAIDKAAKQGHIGETTLRAIALLGRGGPAQAHPVALRRALADLDAVHLHGEAHALAFEAITAILIQAGHGAGP
jgi:hypothetical protein